MTVAFVKTLGTAFNKTSGTTLAHTFAGATSAGSLIVAIVVFDNAATASKPIVSTTTPITKAAGETNDWVFLGAARSTSTSAGAFASGELWCIRTTVIWPIASYTVTLDTAVTQKAIAFSEFSGVQAVLRSTTGTAYSTTTTAASATTTGTTPQVNDLTLGYMFTSNSTGYPDLDVDTTGGTWGLIGGTASSGSSAATNNNGGLTYKVLNAASHQTLNGSGSTTAGNGAIVAILQAAPEPTITQAAYRIYDDGTETGAVALAAQDTPAQGDIVAGDGIGQLRVRLQSTNSGSIPATDDWQLQWEKNASGSWTNVSYGTLVDGYAETNHSTNLTIGTTGLWGRGQSFLGNGGKLSQAGFFIEKTGSPTFNITAQLFAHTGTFGTGTGIATGPVLATSSIINAVTVPVGKVWVDFLFDSSYTLTNTTPYCIILMVSAVTTSDGILMGNDSTTPTHAGVVSTWNGSTWSGSSANDIVFRIYTSGTVAAYPSPNTTDGAVTTNRLGAGSGSFSAGEISDTGLVTDLGFAPNGYTELLFPVAIKKVDVVAGDTIRFRVLRNGSTTGMTYTAVPTVNVVESAITQAAYGIYADGTETGSTAYTNTEVLAENYDETKRDADRYLYSGETIHAQSFLGNGSNLTRCGFFIAKAGAPNGDVTASLWAHAGVFGTAGLPTGSPLATSTTSYTITSLSTTQTWYYFDFDGTFTLAKDTPYFIGITSTNTAAFGNNIVTAYDNTAQTHAGRGVIWTSFWVNGSGDFVFKVYTTSVILDVSNSDANAQVRLRLQETGGAPIPATSDFQLQYEKNTSGSWNHVISEGIADSYSETNVDSSTNFGDTATTKGGQTFLGDGKLLVKAAFWLAKTGVPTTAIVAELWTHSGTFGSTGVGSAIIATSTNSYVGGDLSTTFAWFEFLFDSIPLTLSTPYVIVVSAELNTSGNRYVLGFDATSSSHPGNRVQFVPSSWTSYSTSDLAFRVYTSTGTVAAYNSANLTDAAATTNRLGSGSGSFVAGKVSEDGLADDVGWTGNNFTELLYSITLKQADLADGDTLRFRVLRNGLTAGQTYTQYPTVTVNKDAVAITQAAYLFSDGDSFENDPILTDSYLSYDANFGISGVTTAFAQSFTGAGGNLSQAGFRLYKSGTPSGLLTAVLYAHTGTFGTTGKPTGSALATSAAFNPTALTGTGQWIYFDFDGSYTLVNGTNYCIAIETSVAGDVSNRVLIQLHQTSPSHAGNKSSIVSGPIWSADNSQDLAFQIYTSGALAALNTAPVIDISSGDVNAQVRMRLQSTSVANIPSTDDFQLQWEKNTNGNWNDVTSTAPSVLDDSATISNATMFLSAADTNNGVGQTFTATTNGELTSVEFRLGRTGAPPGAITAHLYAHTGTFGTTSGIPTGSPLASSTSRTATTLNTTVQWEVFVFDGTYALTSGTPYCIVVEYTLGDASNYVSFEYHSAGSHDGARTARNRTTSVWSSPSTLVDSAFRIYTAGDPTTAVPYNSTNLTDAAATTNRLGAGSGSFVAGKISEDGLADNVGWTGNNFTELLYSITIKQADLVDADTLRFRVLRNGTTTGLTFTQYPSLTISSGTPTIDDHLYLGDLLVAAMKLGDVNVVKAYLGDTQIFPAS